MVPGSGITWGRVAVNLWIQTVGFGEAVNADLVEACQLSKINYLSFWLQGGGGETGVRHPQLQCPPGNPPVREGLEAWVDAGGAWQKTVAKASWRLPLALAGAASGMAASRASGVTASAWPR